MKLSNRITNFIYEHLNKDTKKDMIQQYESALYNRLMTIPDNEINVKIEYLHKKIVERYAFTHTITSMLKFIDKCNNDNIYYAVPQHSQNSKIKRNKKRAKYLINDIYFLDQKLTKNEKKTFIEPTYKLLNELDNKICMDLTKDIKDKNTAILEKLYSQAQKNEEFFSKIPDDKIKITDIQTLERKITIDTFETEEIYRNNKIVSYKLKTEIMHNILETLEKIPEDNLTDKQKKQIFEIQHNLARTYQYMISLEKTWIEFVNDNTNLMFDPIFQ